MLIILSAMGSETDDSDSIWLQLIGAGAIALTVGYIAKIKPPNKRQTKSLSSDSLLLNNQSVWLSHQLGQDMKK